MIRGVSVPRTLRERALVVVGLVALIGGCLAVSDMLKAVRQAEDLYSVGMLGLSIEGDLQASTQESRRTFVYALTTNDPNVQLQYVNAARRADGDVARLQAAFGRVPVSANIRDTLTTLVSEWKAYVKVRDEMIGQILEDRPDLALEQERGEGALLFETCSNRLEILKQLLDESARERLGTAHATFFRCAVEVGMLILTALAFVGSLRMLAGLRQSNQRLSHSEHVERQRSRILESISQNSPLSDIFQAIISLGAQPLPEARGAISLLQGQHLFYSEAALLPLDFVRESDGLFADFIDSPRTLNQSAYFRQKLEAASRYGLSSCWSVPILRNNQQLAGTLEYFFNAAGEPSNDQIRALERIAQIAALAIEHRQVNDQLAFQAQHDSLTGLANRIMFQDRATKAIARAALEGSPLAVIWIDLDRFKQVNDILGHHVGDALLQQVARRLTASVRSTDIVARIGGDEFVILLGQCDDSEAALRVAQTVLERLNEPVSAFQHQLGIGASLGVALFPNHGDTFEHLLRSADAAMYSAKAEGKNMARLFSPGMGKESSELLEIDAQLRSGLQENQFRVHYQPQVSGNGELVCLEALVRWAHPTLGTIPPARFIPVAEENGVIVPLGAWVLKTACIQAADFHNSGVARVRVAVNVSLHQFVKSDFVSTVSRALEESGLPPRFLELEITENAVMRNLQDTVHQLERLRSMGVRISIDDFGTGNSSLSYLQDLPLDSLKIDRSFINAIEGSGSRSMSLIRAIVGLAHGLNLTVVAEGIETEAQSDLLRKEGCDLLQGYAFCRPVPVPELTSWIAARKEKARKRPYGLETYDLLAISQASTGVDLELGAS